ncbi:MAG: response regulator [Deltaproteobacteria bacterium]|nr:response regulator [Deltaproteobacteria bacterium]
MNVLYVEDNPIDANLTRHELRKSAPEINLDVVSTQHEALATLEKRPGYDLVLTDMRLPDGDGLAILTHIRGRSLPLPVVLITGHGDDETAVAGLKAGADDYIVKREGYLLHLPAVLETALQHYRTQAALRSRPIRVLYAEHHAAAIDLPFRYMAAHAPHIQLEKVYSGLEVLQRLAVRDRLQDYDVILMDYRLPGLSALEVLKELRQIRRSDVPVVLITGQGNEEPAVEALKLGATDYVIKHSGYLHKLPFVLENAFHRTQLSRKHAALAESEAKYRALVEQIPAVVYLGAPDGPGRILYISPQIELLSGFSAGQWTTDPELRTRQIHPADRVRVLSELAQTQTAGLPVVSEYRLVTKDGRSRWLRDEVVLVQDEAGTPIFIQGIMIDITDRKLAEEERVRLTTAMEQIAEGILITDTNWIIRYVNPAFEHMSGYKREEILGQHSRLFKSDIHHAAFYKNMGETLLKGEIWKSDFTSKRKDGTLYEVKATISPVRDSLGEIINFVLAERDVTYESMLERQLRQTQKMESIGTLAGGIAHDFNNILTGIIGFAELSFYEPSLESGLRRNLEQILIAGNRAKSLIQQILTFSRQGDQKIMPVQLEPIIKEVVKLLRASLPTTIEIRQNITVNSGMVMADPTQIHQVLMNLCTNAAHAMQGEGGVLNILLEDAQHRPDDKPQIPDLDPGHYMKLTVSDTGYGISRDILDRIFDPFFTTKKPGEGTGMGLAVVHGIIKSHHGAITVGSEPGSGTIFCVYLPRIEGISQSRPKPHSPLPKGNEVILFVDDEKPITELGRMLLERLGYHVMVTTNSLEALSFFQDASSAVHFDLVITDQTMPQMTGLRLAQEIIKLRPDFPVILFTGSNEEDFREKALALGVSEFLMKPLDLRNLAEAVRRAIDKGRIKQM